MKRFSLNVRGVETELLLMNAAALSEEELAVIASNASEYRLGRARAYRFERDRRLCMTASALLDAMLKAFGTSEKQAKTGFTEFGKPYYPDVPVSFSLSHSYDHVLVAYTACEAQIGCDIELIRPFRRETALRLLDSEAREEYLRLPESEADRFFFNTWTRMESYVKATGEGGAAIRKLAPEKRQLSLPLPEGITPEGYAAAVCVL